MEAAFDTGIGEVLGWDWRTGALQSVDLFYLLLLLLYFFCVFFFLRLFPGENYQVCVWAWNI